MGANDVGPLSVTALAASEYAANSSSLLPHGRSLFNMNT
jgi:hypothetical protein